jgi:hypothetical protein
MNSKILIAFSAGAVLASGIVYLAVKDEAPPRPAAASTAIPIPAPAPAIVPVKTPATAAPPLETLAPPPVRQKPSPMPPPIRREKPAAVARTQDPPPRPAPEPLPEVVAKQPDPQPPPPPPPIEAQIPPEPQPPQATAPPEDVAPAQPEPEVRVPHTVTIAAGTLLPVRIGETLSAAHNQAGDGFLATLDQPLVVDGFVIAERGSRLEGRVVEANTRLGIELVKLSTADGQHIQIRTQAFSKDPASSAGSDAAKVGAGAALGAAIGAVAGGGKGAAIGVGAGAAAGVAGAMLSRGKTVKIPVETRIRFRIADPVVITEHLN